MQRMGRQLVWAAVLAMTTSVISVPPAVAGTRGGHNQEDRNRDRDRNQDRNRDRTVTAIAIVATTTIVATITAP